MHKQQQPARRLPRLRPPSHNHVKPAVERPGYIVCQTDAYPGQQLAAVHPCLAAACTSGDSGATAHLTPLTTWYSCVRFGAQSSYWMPERSLKYRKVRGLQMSRYHLQP